MDVTSPAKERHVVGSSDDSSISDDDTPLLSLIPQRPPQSVNPVRETSPPPTADPGDYSDGREIEFQNLMSRAMQSLDNVTEVSRE